MRYLPLGLLVGCPRPLDPEQPCEEIAYAIGARTEECTGDGELGEARVQALLDTYECLDRAEVAEGQSESGGDDAFACALVLRDVACELVAEAGDDLDAWLSFSPSCRLALGAPGAADTGGP